MNNSLYFCRQGETIADIVPLLPDNTFTAPMSFDERIRQIERMNPHVAGFQVLAAGDVLMLGDEAGACICEGSFAAFQTRYKLLPVQTRQFFDQAGEQDGIITMEALGRLKDDIDKTYAEYGALGFLGDANTFGQGVVVGISVRHDQLVDEMRRIDAVLREYAQAPKAAKPALKVRAKAMHQRLQQRFAVVIDARLAHAKGSYAAHPAYHFNRAHRLAGRGIQTPYLGGARGAEFFRYADKLKYVGRGLWVLDIGLRANNIYESQNRLRTGFGELGGFAMSGTVTLWGGALAMSLTLGPLGWIIAIIVIGAGAVIADHYGKSIGESIYDSNSFAIDSGADLVLNSY